MFSARIVGSMYVGVGYLQIWNMSSVSWVLVLLRQTEVDYVAHVL